MGKGLAALGAALALAQTPPPGITRAELFDNATVLTARLRMEPGARETSHTHPFSAVVIQMTPGEIEMTNGGVRGRAARPAGFVWFVAKETPHMAANVGTRPVEFVTVGIKPTRPPAAAGPVTQAPAGISRETVFENDEARVVRVTFSPAGREPVHSHPNDLVTVQVTAGRVEILEGGAKTTEERAPGYVRFLPRDVPHAYASADAKPFELLSVTIK